MSVELEELFHDLDLDAPTMSVSADSVVASGQQKVRRRRAAWGAGTGALAAAAAVAIAVGTAIPNSSSPSPMPAHSSTAARLGSFFARDGGAPTPRDEAQFSPMASGSDPSPTPQTTYQVYRSDDGVLRIRRVDKSGEVDLPAVTRYPDGGSATNDRAQTIIVRPVPADVTTVDLNVGSNSLAGGIDIAPIVLPDGTTAALFATQHAINPSSVGDASWWTSSGALRTSSGDSAEVVLLPGSDPASTVKFWYLPASARCGVRATFTGGASSGTDFLQTGGVCSTGLGYGTKVDGTTDRSVWALMMPGPISDVVTHPQPGQPDQAPQRTELSDGRILLWSLKTTPNGLIPYKTVSWTGPDGSMHTWPGA